MHVLIIPSEEFIPKHSHLSGIFQKHQAVALRDAGCKVGIISISQEYSIWMILKLIVSKLMGKQTINKLRTFTASQLFKLLHNKIFRIDKFIELDQVDGFTIYRIRGFYFLPPSKHTNHIGWIKAGKKLWDRYCSDNGIPDIIHAHNGVYAGLLARKLSAKYHIPYLITEHSSFIARNLESFLIKPNIKRAYVNASEFFVVSEYLGKSINKVFKNDFKWRVLPNVLDAAIEHFEVKSDETNHGKFTFISIGSLIPIKRHKDIIDAFQNSFATNSNVQLFIAGDGELQRELENKILSNNLMHQVKLLGRLDREEIIRLIDSCHCLVLSSEIETFGVVIIEALSRGKPVIATRCGGPESILDISNGILYEVGNTKELSVALEKMLRTYSSFDFKKIKEDAIQKYGQQKFGYKLLHEYEILING